MTTTNDTEAARMARWTALADVIEREERHALPARAFIRTTRLSAVRAAVERLLAAYGGQVPGLVRAELGA